MFFYILKNGNSPVPSSQVHAGLSLELHAESFWVNMQKKK